MMAGETNDEALGLSALGWTLSDDARASRFLALTGLTPTTAQMCFHEMPRPEYLKRLAALSGETVHPGRWEAEADSKTVADWRPTPTVSRV